MLALDYMRRSRTGTPETEMKAVQFINLGYQRLLNFEVAGGGFDWYGKAPANLVLSAYGLVQFSDMAKVYEIDPRIITRTQKYLLGKQAKDGSWSPEGRMPYSWKGLAGKYIITSYIAWSMAESGYPGKELTLALDWMKDNLDEAPSAYARALAANALLEVNKKDREGLAILKSLAAEMKDGGVENEDQTLYFAKGNAAAIETTALVALAMMKTPDYPTKVNKALSYLIKRKDARGTWGSTSATILALKALIGGMSGIEQKGDVTLTISVNGEERKLTITPDQADVMQILDFAGATKKGTNTVTIDVEGESNMMYQIFARHFIPWGEVQEEDQPLSIDVSYDKTKLSTDDVLTANVKMKYSGSQETFMVIMDLGIPPGFILDTTKFEEMVEAGTIDKFSTTGRQITLYLGKIKPGQEVNFSYELYPKYPIKVKTPKSEVYEYYTPERRAESQPVEVEVEKE